MKGPDVTLTNGRYEFRSSARGSILYLSDPPEAGWHMRKRTDESAVGQDRVHASADDRGGHNAFTSPCD